MKKFLKPLLSLAVLGFSSCSVVQSGVRIVEELISPNKTVVLSDAEVDQLVRGAFSMLNERLSDSTIPAPIILVDSRGIEETQRALRRKNYEVDFQVGANMDNIEVHLARAAKEANWSYADKDAVEIALEDAGCDVRPAAAAVRLPKYRDLIRNTLRTDRSDPVDHVLIGKLNVGKSQQDGYAIFRLDLDLVSLATPELHSGTASIDRELPWMGLGDVLGGLSTDTSREYRSEGPGPRGRQSR